MPAFNSITGDRNRDSVSRHDDGVIEREAERLLLSNRRSGYSRRHGRSYGYTCPSPRDYPYQWFWDSCFHAVVLTHFDPQWAQRELLSLVSVQREDGFLPHVIFWETGPLNQFWKYLQADNPIWPRVTGYIQPPVLAHAALTVFNTTADRSFGEAMLAAVRRFHAWLRRSRDIDDDGLISIASPFESGLDWSPQFDSLFRQGWSSDLFLAVTSRIQDLQHWLAKHDDARMLQRFDVEEILTNCVWYEAQTSLADLAEKLGEMELARDEREAARRTQAAVLEKCWDPEAGAFFSLSGREERQLQVLTNASLTALLLDDLSREQCDALVGHLLDARGFAAPYPVPTVAVGEPSFRRKPRYLLWRGATWLNLNWFIVRGLLKHGEFAAAAHITERTAELVQRAGYRESYAPYDGAGLGAPDFGWSTLAVDMLCRIEGSAAYRGGAK